MNAWKMAVTLSASALMALLAGCVAPGGAYSGYASSYQPNAFLTNPYTPPSYAGGMMPLLQPQMIQPYSNPLPAININRYNPNSLANPYGAGSPYKSDGLMNPYSQNGSPYSNQSWTNPYATNAPRLYDAQGNYRGRLSANRYDPDSTSNPYGRYGSPYSADSINNPYGAGNPYSTNPIFVVPSK